MMEDVMANKKFFKKFSVSEFMDLSIRIEDRF